MAATTKNNEYVKHQPFRLKMINNRRKKEDGEQRFEPRKPKLFASNLLQSLRGSVESEDMNLNLSSGLMSTKINLGLKYDLKKDPIELPPLSIAEI
jgi:hypothetical protein